MCNKFSKELSGHRSYVSTSVVVKINRVVKTTLSPSVLRTYNVTGAHVG